MMTASTSGSSTKRMKDYNSKKRKRAKDLSNELSLTCFLKSFKIAKYTYFF